MLLTTTLGQNIVSKTTAETVGTVDGVVIDAATRTVTAFRVGKGRKAKLVPWPQVSGVGTAAVVVEDDDALHAPAEGTEQRFASGDITLIGARVLSEAGNSQGTVVDVDYDDGTGALTNVQTTQGGVIVADRLRAVGTYAWVVAVDESTPAL